MNINLNSKPVRYALIAVSLIVLVGGIKAAGGSSSPTEAGSFVQAMTPAEAEQQLKAARDKGVEQGIEAAHTNAPDVLTVRAASSLAKSDELARADLDLLICARGNAYLNSSSRLATENQINQDAWLREQLRTENQVVKEASLQFGSISGDAAQVSQVQTALTNRAAILYAIRNIGRPMSCRVSTYESAEAIDQTILIGNQIDHNRQVAASQHSQPLEPLESFDFNTDTDNVQASEASE